MKSALLIITSVCVLMLRVQAQPIHSHNDYTHQRPFWEAYENKAGVIEADVFAVHDTLMVAHSKNEIESTNTLQGMYINPIVKLFEQYNNTVSADSSYTFYLMIDIKENYEQVLPLLMRALQHYPFVFDRTKNKNAIQIFISGERPPDSLFITYSSFIKFDGLPGKNYTDEELKKIVMISDDFANSSHWNGKDSLPQADKKALLQLIQEAHAENKPIRFWDAPDTPFFWKTLIALGADVINTDKVKECRQFLSKPNH